MAEIVWTDEAKLWLREIFEYVASEHPDTAVLVVDGILARAESLRTFPELHPRPGLPRSVRPTIHTTP
jgi:plasmid stabilization system protein ParE